jgi:hypothetical protein
MPDPYREFYTAFLHDHPEHLAGVKLTVIEGEQHLMMTATTLRRFIQWALGMGLVGDEAKALGVLADIPNLENRARQACAAKETTTGDTH